MPNLCPSAAAKVIFFTSSMAWIYKVLLDLNTEILGRVAQPEILALILLFLLILRLIFLFNTFALIPYPYFLDVLPALRIIRSLAYFTPLPLYGSGGLNSRICAATCPTTCLSLPLTITLFLSTLISIPAGIFRN